MLANIYDRVFLGNARFVNSLTKLIHIDLMVRSAMISFMEFLSGLFIILILRALLNSTEAPFSLLDFLLLSAAGLSAVFMVGHLLFLF